MRSAPSPRNSGKLGEAQCRLLLARSAAAASSATSSASPATGPSARAGAAVVLLSSASAILRIFPSTIESVRKRDRMRRRSSGGRLQKSSKATRCRKLGARHQRRQQGRVLLPPAPRAWRMTGVGSAPRRCATAPAWRQGPRRRRHGRRARETARGGARSSAAVRISHPGLLDDVEVGNMRIALQHRRHDLGPWVADELGDEKRRRIVHDGHALGEPHQLL
jgi:hypothetical protein